MPKITSFDREQNSPNLPRTLLNEYAVEPKRSLGQNFLHDPIALDRVVAAIGLTAGETVLEVGPGTGALTVRLAQIAGKVVTVEIDERLIPILKATLVGYPNVTVVHADILKTSITDLVGDGPYCVAANLPYYITSAILRHLLEVSHKPTRLALTVQEEVAERITAPPGDFSLLAVSVQYYGKPRIAAKIGAASFWPRPTVSSAILCVDVYPQPLVDVPSDAEFFRVVRAGFGQKRKQLKNSLSAGLSCTATQAETYLRAAGIDPMRRAETLTIEEWAALCRAVAA